MGLKEEDKKDTRPPYLAVRATGCDEPAVGAMEGAASIC